MKISKIFAGLSAAAIMASMAAAVPASADTVQLYNCGFNVQVGHVKHAILSIKVQSSDNTIWDWESKSATSEGYMYNVQASWNADSPADEERNDIPGQFEDDGTTPKQAKGAGYVNNWDSGMGKYNGMWAQITLTDPDLSKLTFIVEFSTASGAKWEYHTPKLQSESAEEWYETVIFCGGDTTPPLQPTSGESREREKGGYACIVPADVINSQFGGVTKDKADTQENLDAAVAAAKEAGIEDNGFYEASYSATYEFSGSDVEGNSPEVTEAGEWSDGADESKADESKADDSKGDNSSSGDSTSKADTSSAAADGSSASDTSSAADGVDAGSTDTANAGNSDSSSSSTAAASASSSSSTAAASANSKSSTSSTAASATKSSTTTTTSSSAAAPAGGGSDGSAESDATSNAASGAAAGVGLAITAVAAAAIVVSKRRD